MSDETDAGGKPIIVGGRVFVKDKNLEGIVKFVGTTDFAPGKWIGIQLGEPKGKNNGSIQGKQYFTCPDSCGLFVRQNQIMMLDSVQPTKSDSRIPMPSSLSKRSPRGSPAQIRKPPSAAGDSSKTSTPSAPTSMKSTSQPTLPSKEVVKEQVLYLLSYLMCILCDVKVKL